MTGNDFLRGSIHLCRASNYYSYINAIIQIIIVVVTLAISIVITSFHDLHADKCQCAFEVDVYDCSSISMKFPEENQF